MKITLTLSLVFLSYLALAQTQNEELFKAVVNRDSTQVEALLNSGADPNYKRKAHSIEVGLLPMATINHDFKIVKLLVEHKVDINERDPLQGTALLYAANQGNVAMVKFLLEHGADPNAKDVQDHSVLDAAKWGGNEEVIKLIESALKK